MAQIDVLKLLEENGGQMTSEELYVNLPLSRRAIRDNTLRLKNGGYVKILTKNIGSKTKGFYRIILVK